MPSFFYPFAPNFRKKFCLSLFLKIKIKNRFYSAREETEEKREKREKREREECDGVQPIRVERSGSCDWKCKEKDRQCDSVTVLQCDSVCVCVCVKRRKGKART